MIPSTDMVQGSNRDQKPHERFVRSGQRPATSGVPHLRETGSGGVRRRVSTKYEARITLAVRLHRDVSSVSRRPAIGLSLPPFHMHAAAALSRDRGFWPGLGHLRFHFQNFIGLGFAPVEISN